MLTLVDAVYTVILLVATTVYEYKYFWPRFRAAVAGDRPGARRGAYRRVMVGEWGLTLVALAIWLWARRAWSDLGLTTPHGWRLAVSIAIVLLVLALLGLQLVSVLRLSTERRIEARPKLGELAFLVPRTAADHRLFVALSITAGFCEELLFRGYLPWVFAPWLGRVGALLFVAALFGAGHLYQGARGALKATLAGLSFVAIVLVTGSLIPAMIVHALIDIGGGTVGYLLLRDDPALPTQSELTAGPLKPMTLR